MKTETRIKRVAKKTYPITDGTTFNGIMQDAFIEGAMYERSKTTNEIFELMEKILGKDECNFLISEIQKRLL